jgi:hypothetical protein
MPNFYANYTEMPHVCHPGILPYMFPFINFCTTIESYNFTRDADGNPTVEDCQKNSFVNYYFSPESMSLFERLYSTEKGGL